MQLNRVQRVILACDRYVTPVPNISAMLRDQMARAFIAGYSSALYDLHTTEDANTAAALIMVAMGGYPRIHSMAKDLEAKLDAHSAGETGDDNLPVR